MSGHCSGTLINKQINRVEEQTRISVKIRNGPILYSPLPFGPYALMPSFSLRKIFAAYYTKRWVSKFLAELVLDGPGKVILDPACGSGALLIAAQQKLQELNSQEASPVSSSLLVGNEIDPFGVIATGIKLATQPQFPLPIPFEVRFGDAFDLEMPPPQAANIILGNPPFTRGERLGAKYKQYLQAQVIRGQAGSGNGKDAYIAQNMPLSGYFLLDMDRFLAPDGIFGVILPASVLHLANLESIRRFLLQHYSINYIISSQIEPFSEQTDLKEVIFVGRWLNGEQAGEWCNNIKIVTMLTPITGENYVSLVGALQSSEEDCENVDFMVHSVSREQLEVALPDWSVLLQSTIGFQLIQEIWETDRIERVKDLEGGKVRAFRGFRQDFARYWAVPNPDWQVTTASEEGIVIQVVLEPTRMITIPQSAIYEGLSRPEDYAMPIIGDNCYYILHAPKREYSLLSPALEGGLANYCAFVQQRLHETGGQYELFLDQINRIGKYFEYAGRIAFCHRIDVTTSRIVCYYSPQPRQLNQNWFSIRGFDPPSEEFLAAWFNSTPFIAAYLSARRAQRGPYGQTAMRQFRNYPVPMLAKISQTNLQQVISQFREFNTSPLLAMPLNRQFEVSLEDDSDRTLLDLAILDALGFHETNLTRQKLFLQDLYRALVGHINQLRKQRR